MKLAVLIFCLFFPYLVNAAPVSVVAIEEGPAAMVKVATGEVLWVSSEKLKQTLRAGLRTDRQVDIRFDADHTIRSARLTNIKAIDPEFEESSSLKDAPEPAYYPTVYTSVAQVQQLHNSMDNRTFDDSQCYNRAHGWAYDLWRQHGTNSMKIFLFFTDRYIREYRHKWWFHVAPMTYVQDQYGTNEYVLDRSFSEAPVYTQVWTNIFIKNQAVCRSVSHYDDYRKDDPSEWCFLMRSSMYYRGTVGIKKRDRGQKYRTKWSSSEIREARKQAFIYARDYEL